MWSGRALGQQRSVLRFDPEDLNPGLTGFEGAAHPGDRAAGADTGDEDVDIAVGVRPDLFGGGLLVDRRVGGVGELVAETALSVSAMICFALATAPAMPSEPG